MSMASGIKNIKKVGLCTIDYCNTTITETESNYGFHIFLGGLLISFVGFAILYNPTANLILSDISKIIANLSSITSSIADPSSSQNLANSLLNTMQVVLCVVSVSGLTLSILGWGRICYPTGMAVDGYYVFLHNENEHLLKITEFKKATDNQENIKLMKENVDRMEEYAQIYNQNRNKKTHDELEMIAQFQKE